MADRSRGFHRGRQIPRRLISWELGPGGTAPTVINSTVAIFLGSALSSSEDGLTVVRIRGELLVYMLLATTSNDGFSGAFGIGLASEAAVTAGAASVPTPITESSADMWLYHRFFSVKSPVAFASGAAQDGPSLATSFRLEVDSKAMRKLIQEDALYAMIEVAEVGTASIEVHFDSRILVKLP